MSFPVLALAFALAGGVPQVLVLPLEAKGDVGDLAEDALGYQLTQALARSGRAPMTDPSSEACASDACALLAGRAVQATHVLFGQRSGGRVNVFCVSTETGERTGELLDLPLDAGWSERAADLVPLEVETREPPPAWGPVLANPVERFMPTEDRRLRLLGGIASGVGFTGVAAALCILAAGALSGTAVPAYAQWGGNALFQKPVLLVLGGVGAAGFGVLGVALLVTMVPTLVLGVVLLLWAGVLD
jgi:hypothetical protein